MLAAGRELLRLHPAEIVRPAGASGRSTCRCRKPPGMPEGVGRSVRTDGWRWRPDRAEDTLLRHFGVGSLDGFGCAGKPFAIRAAGGLLALSVRNADRRAQARSPRLTTYSIDRYMTLDAANPPQPRADESARRRKAAQPDRRARSDPHADGRAPAPALARSTAARTSSEIEARQTRSQHSTATPCARADAAGRARADRRLERLVNRAITGNAHASRSGPAPRLARSAARHSAGPARQPNPAPAMPECADVGRSAAIRASSTSRRRCSAEGRRSGRGFSAELDGHQRPGPAKRASGSPVWSGPSASGPASASLKVGYNKVFGYYLEVTTAALANAERERRRSVLPDEYIPKQSLTNATRYFTPQLKEYETVVLTARGDADGDSRATSIAGRRARSPGRPAALLEAAERSRTST